MNNCNCYDICIQNYDCIDCVYIDKLYPICNHLSIENNVNNVNNYNQLNQIIYNGNEKSYRIQSPFVYLDDIDFPFNPHPFL